MKRTACRLFFCLLCLRFLTACGTIVSLAEQDYTAYAGVTRDFGVIQEGGLLGVIAVIDLPLSFVLDTLLLPFSLSQ